MITIQGTGVSAGIAKGPLVFLRRTKADHTKQEVRDVRLEKERLKAAQETAASQLEMLAEKCRADAADAAVLFETHAMFVYDEDLVFCITEILEKERCNAEYAVRQAGEQFAEMLAEMDDPYMRERAADIRDVAKRICDNLSGVVTGAPVLQEPVILCADDLAPSETMQLDKRKLLALVTRKGSVNSHTAILARTMGIPAICGVGNDLQESYEGRAAWIDGETGTLTLDPDGAAFMVLSEKYDRQLEHRRLLEAMRGKEDVTPDGRKIAVCCNISSPEDISAVLGNDGRGIGLFRSEFLYLGAAEPPTEEEQFFAYRAVASAMHGKRVVIRTLDIGADKQVGYFNMEKEENPALGVRAVRFCLGHPEVFHTQLRALYRASAYGKIAIMFPMIASVWEVRECRRICRSVMAELDAEGIAYDENTEIGIMIETPASALIADALAEEVDFFSVGTNDLTQYMLACDRQSNVLQRHYDPHHPAVLRALKIAADAAHGAGKWIGICGELASDPELLPTFLAIGIDELSVSPASVLPLRAAIRQCTVQNGMLDKLQ